MKEYAGDGGRRAKRAKRKTYVDGMSSSDEESDVLENGLDPEDLYKQKVYPPFFVKEMLPSPQRMNSMTDFFDSFLLHTLSYKKCKYF